MNAFMNFQPNMTFIEGLHQNTEDIVITGPDQRNNAMIKAEVKEIVSTLHSYTSY